MIKVKTVVIGAGFGGLSAAALLAKEGMEVEVIEKNEQIGGRASVYSEGGFNFDMGPSWYLMPDVFERFFAEFGKKPQDFFELKRLDPAYRIYFDGSKVVDISADLEKNYELFDSLESNGAEKLKKYLKESKEKYELAIMELLYRDYSKLSDLADRRLMRQGLKLNLFEKLDTYVNKHFESDEAKKIVEYSIGFLGSAPNNTPSFYHIMSHIDFNLGVWYPDGGMRKVAQSIKQLAESYGAKITLNEPVTKIGVPDRKVRYVNTLKSGRDVDICVVNADYAHSELELLDERHVVYDRDYWEKRVLAPSAFVAYVGIDKKVDDLAHHTLFLDKDWAKGFSEIFDPSKAAWPISPSYYVNVPSKTDRTAAPSGCESLFILVPLAPGIEDTEAIREKFFKKIITSLEGTIKENLTDHILVKKIFALTDFAKRYNAYKGTALGLSHTMRQTAMFRPAHRSKKVKNLFYTGHYTHPGIGVPMVLISSQIVANEIKKYVSEGGP